MPHFLTHESITRAYTHYKAHNKPSKKTQHVYEWLLDYVKSEEAILAEAEEANDCPTVTAVEYNGQARFLCVICGKYHYHSFAEGHRVAHCPIGTGYHLTNGYNLKILV